VFRKPLSYKYLIIGSSLSTIILYLMLAFSIFTLFFENVFTFWFYILKGFIILSMFGTNVLAFIPKFSRLDQIKSSFTFLST